MRKVHTYEISSVTGHGKNKTKAMHNAIDKAALAIAEYDKGPILIPAPPSMPGVDPVGALIIFYKYGAWEYACLDKRLNLETAGTVRGANETRENVVYKAVQHYGDTGADYKAPWEAINAWLDEITLWLTGALHDASEALVLTVAFRERATDTKRYQAWLGKGYNDVEAHHGMCEKRNPPDKL